MTIFTDAFLILRWKHGEGGGEEDRETEAIGEGPRPISFRHVLAWITATYSAQEQQSRADQWCQRAHARTGAHNRGG